MYWLRTFGGLAIQRNGASLDQVGAHRKALALLAVLAAQGRVRREWLMTLLWPESDADRAKGSLNQALHLLRRQLGAPDLLQGVAELRLNPDRIESDIGLFSRALERGDDAAAVRHYDGPFLDGVHVDGTAEFERWASARRAELERQYMQALERLARSAEARGEHAAAVEWWRRLQRTDPPNSRIAVSLMLALESAGDRAAALQHARIHQTLLREEWGLAPDPAVEALAERLRALGRQPPVGIDSIPALGLNIRPPARHQHPRPAGGSGQQASAPSRMRPRWRTLLALSVLLGLGGVAAIVAVTPGRAVSEIPREEALSPQIDASAVPAPEPASIAVLPFIDLSPGQDQEYFSDGMTEELITTLSRVRGLHVVARTSAFQFKGSNPDLRDVGERLRVAHVVEGSVRRTGERLRVTAQLVSTETGYQLWSETYERESRDLFAVQEEISRAIVEALQHRLGPATNASPVPVPVEDMEAYEHYLKGLHFFNRLQIPQAIEHLQEATRRAPQFARAYAALAEAYAVPAAYSDLSPLDSRNRGVVAAETALQIDPALAEGHSALGWLEMLGFRWGEADRALSRAIELDPHAARSRFYYALYLHRVGRLEDAFAQLRRARELDPLSLSINAIYGSLLGDLGDVDAAVAHLEATLELDPSFPITHAVLGHIYLGTGRMDDAIRHYERVAELVPTSFYIGFLGHAYASAGRVEDARRLLDGLKAQEESGEHVSPGAVGWILLGLDERDEGFRWLERAARQRDVFLTVYAALTNRYLIQDFRDDPRLHEVRRGIGLPPTPSVGATLSERHR